MAAGFRDVYKCVFTRLSSFFIIIIFFFVFVHETGVACRGERKFVGADADRIFTLRGTRLQTGQRIKPSIFITIIVV